MPFPRRLLTEGEDLHLDLRPHWKMLIPAFLWTVLVVGAMAAVYVFLSPSGSLVFVPAGAAVVALLVLAVPRVLKRHFTEFVLTNERVITRSGVLAKRAKEIPLEAINDVAFRQTLLDRLFNAGDLILESAGERGQEVFDDIHRPEEVQKAIYSAAEARKGLAGPVATQSSVADELTKLGQLVEKGLLTTEEFEARKRSLLGS